MTIKEMYIKNFQRSKAVIIERIDESGRKTTHWVIPEANNVAMLDGIDGGIVLHNECKYLSTKYNLPTYLLYAGDCQPVPIKDIKREGIYTSQQLKLIINNQEYQKVYSANNKTKFSDEAKIMILVIIIGFVGLGYFLNVKIQDTIPVDPTPIVEEVVTND